MLNRTFVILLLCLFPITSAAQTLQDARPGFMQTCADQGTEERFCACFFDNWAVDVAPDQIPGALIAVDIFQGNPPTDADQLALGNAAYPALQDTILACVSGQLVPLVVAPGLPPIPQTNDQAELDQLIERLASGQASLDEMMRHDALTMELREQARAAEEQAEADRDARAVNATEALGAAHASELARIEARELESWPLSEFEAVHRLYCQMNGGTQEECVCSWITALDWANGRQNFLYLASRDYGNDVGDYMSPFAAQAIRNVGLPGMAEQVDTQCFAD